jgi:cytochrome b
VIWGLVGIKYARFRGLKYARILVFKHQGFNETHISHNPLGGLMVVTLMLSLTLTCISGAMVYTLESNRFYDFFGQSLLQGIDEHKQYIIA